MGALWKASAEETIHAKLMESGSGQEQLGRVLCE